MTSFANENYFIQGVSDILRQTYIDSYLSTKVGFMFAVVILEPIEFYQFDTCYEATRFITTGSYKIFLNKDDGTSIKLSEKDIEAFSAFEQDKERFDNFYRYAYYEFYGYPMEEEEPIDTLEDTVA
jgi:hypothetical protein